MFCDIASAIRMIRESQQITQEQLARIAHTSRPHISSIETYAKLPNLATVQRIATALGVSTVVLITFATAKRKETI